MGCESFIQNNVEASEMITYKGISALHKIMLVLACIALTAGCASMIDRKSVV